MLGCLASTARSDVKHVWAGSPSAKGIGNLSCATVLQYSLHTPFARGTAPCALPHSNPVPGVRVGPRRVLWVLVTFASTFCHLRLPAPPWRLLCPASCSCGLSDPRLSHMLRLKYSPNVCMVRALCKSRKISKIQSQHQTSFSPDIWNSLSFPCLLFGCPLPRGHVSPSCPVPACHCSTNR